MKVSRSIRVRWCSMAILIAFATVMLAATITPALAQTPITTCTELQNMKDDLAGDYYLANDIDCSGTSGWDGGAGFEPIGNLSNNFTGTFDGQGYKITHLCINRSSTDYVGLFGFTDSGSEIKDVSLEEVNVSGHGYVSGLVGCNDGTINDCYSSGSVTGFYYVCGLIGYNFGTINNCYSSGSVTGSSGVGGLIGYNFGTINNCYYPGDGITCTGCDNTIGNTTMANLQNETWLTTSPNDWDFDTIWGIEEGVSYPYLQWQYAPKITFSAPPSPVNDTVCTWRTFNVTVNHEVNVSWYLNESSLHTNQSVMEANYTLHAEYVGENNVSAKAENANGTDMQTWVWNVTAAPQTYNCTCGDICVNTTGWWRNNGTFNASGTRIHDAIGNASAGNTVYVYNGSYTENVNVNKQVTLQGEGVGVVNVNASNPDKHVFNVTANLVNITGFTLENATANGKAGIYLGDCVNSCNITNNTVKLNYNGIYLWNADDNNITCNWVHYNTRAGFNLTGGSTGNNISCNNIVANGVLNSSDWEWQFYNDQKEEVEAKNNYWGAAMDNAKIEESIYDWQDDPTNCGNVTYNPFEENPNICAPIPELSTVILLVMGLLMLAGYLRMRRKG